MRKLVPLMLFLALLQNAGAQRMSLHIAPHGSQQFAPQRAFSHAFLYPVPYFSDAFYSEAAYPPGYPSAQPAVIVMQAPPVAEPTTPVAPAEPLLIELQGNRYVRLSGGEASGAEIIDKESAAAEKSLVAAGSYPVREPALTILVFRDGHHEEVSDYTITAGILYARGNYYTDRSWSRRIDLSSLNLPDTVAANRSRGLRFLLPSAPNEVIVGP